MEPLTVVWDMDECMVHASFMNERNYRQHDDARARAQAAGGGGGGGGGDRGARGGFETFHVDLSLDQRVTIHKRPGLDETLAWCHEQGFTLWAFTAALEEYAAPVLDELDPSGHYFGRRGERRMFRPSCTHMYSNTHGIDHMELWVKHLETVRERAALDAQEDAGADAEADAGAGAGASGAQTHAGARGVPSLSRMVLVENNPMACLAQPDNSILVKEFIGPPRREAAAAEAYEKEIGVMTQVRALLSAASAARDVRGVLGPHFNLAPSLLKVAQHFSKSVAISYDHAPFDADAAQAGTGPAANLRASAASVGVLASDGTVDGFTARPRFSFPHMPPEPMSG